MCQVSRVGAVRRYDLQTGMSSEEGGFSMSLAEQHGEFMIILRLNRSRRYVREDISGWAEYNAEPYDNRHEAAENALRDCSRLYRA